MKILIFHGYLLRGTGSNIYNANLAQALAAMGHEVHLLCQEREAEGLEWVNAVGTWPNGRLQVEQLRRAGSSGGTVTVYRPGIGRTLPVYVEDPYEGFDARAYPRLSDPEIENYIAVNVDAVKDVLRITGGVDAALANHLIMGPVILARAGVRPYAVKNHGSDLEYTVKPNPRFLPWVEEGLVPAASVLVGSWHTAASLWEAVPGVPLEEKTGLGPPGVDTDEFAPVEPGERRARLLGEADRIAALPQAGSFGRDEEMASEALREFAAGDGPRVTFVGKLIVSKGVDLLAVAWPLIHGESPDARLLIAGFGAYELGLRALVTALEDGDLESAADIAEVGRGLEGGDPSPLEYLLAFLADPPAGYADAARAAAGSISFSGRLEHHEVAVVVSCSDAMVVPSTFPEAFGMVAAEAAASGALPVCAEHSGLAEVTAVLGAEVPAVRALTGFARGPEAVSEIGRNVSRWLALPREERAQIGRDIAECADRNWSWRGVARDVISASAGQVRPVRPPS